MADPPRWAKAHGHRAHRHGDNDHRRHHKPHRIDRDNRIWRGRDGRYRGERDNGTAGLIIGAGFCALAGHELAGTGKKTLGAIVGGISGGLLGREVERGSLGCR